MNAPDHFIAAIGDFQRSQRALQLATVTVYSGIHLALANLKGEHCKLMGNDWRPPATEPDCVVCNGADGQYLVGNELYRYTAYFGGARIGDYTSRDAAISAVIAERRKVLNADERLSEIE